MGFIDRHDAGVQLGFATRRVADAQPIVLGLVRGGVPVAAEVARALHAPLDALGVRKIGMPSQPELALGAISEDDVVLIDPHLQAVAGLSDDAVNAMIEDARHALDARMAGIRKEIPLLPVANRTVIVVDDGIATGATIRAALAAVRARDAARLVVATPVASSDALARCRPLVDDIVCLSEPPFFGAVGEWYDHFEPTTDDEVISLLRHARADADASPARFPLRIETEVRVPMGGPQEHAADVLVPEHPRALVIFAHGAGSNRRSPRNRAVAHTLGQQGYASLRLDLLSADERLSDEAAFAFPLLASRVRHAIDWAAAQPTLTDLPVVLYGASTGAAVAAIAAATDPRVRALVSRGGRADLVADVMGQIRIPCLFLVGSRDETVYELTEPIVRVLGPRATLEVIPGAGHLFEEPGKLDQVCERTVSWLDAVFSDHRIRPGNAERPV